MQDQAGALVDSTMDALSSMPERFAEILETMKQRMSEWGESIVSIGEESTQKTVDAVEQSFSEMPEKVEEYLSETSDAVEEWGTNIHSSAENASDDTVSIVDEIFAQLPENIQEYLKKALEHVKEWSSGTLESARTGASEALEAVMDYFGQMPDETKNKLSEALENVKKFGTDMADSMETGAEEAVNECISGISKIPGEMGTILDEAASKAKDLGISLSDDFKKMGNDSVQSMIDGIRNKSSDLYDCIKEVLSELVEEAKASLEINSPSGVFADEIGKWIPPGIGEGLKLEMPDLFEDLKKQGESLVQSMIDGLTAMPERATEVLKKTLDEVIEWGSDILEKGKELARGIGKGFEGELPDLSEDLKSQIEDLIRKMRAAVEAESGKIQLDKNITQTYKIQQENGQSFDDSKTEVKIEGETHVHVDLDGEQIAEVTTPLIDRNLGRSYSHAARGI